jgi:hypothetical protein
MENNDNDKEIEIEHRLVIEEEEIDISELPEEIRQAMRLFNKKLSKYEQTEDESLYYELQQDDVAIADGIENWLEDNEAEDEDDEDESYLEESDKSKAQDKQAQAPAPAQAPAQAPSQAPAQAPAQEPAQEPQQAPKVDSVQEKLLAVVKNNIISVQDLQNIIGREPDYPTEKVGNLILKKQYLKPFYELV